MSQVHKAQEEVIADNTALLTAIRESGDAQMSFELICRLAKLILAPFEEDAIPLLSGYLEKQPSLSASGLRALLERAQDVGPGCGYSDPVEGWVAVTPSAELAKRLCDQGQWGALAIYARHWMRAEFMAGGDDGFHWLSVALRKLGYEEVAEACLELALRWRRALSSDRQASD